MSFRSFKYSILVKKMKYLFLFCFSILLMSCQEKQPQKEEKLKQYITILGTAQDGGYPHIGCQKMCCTNFYNGTNKKKSVVAIGLVDKENQQKWLFEASPDMHTQLAELENNHLKKETIIDGVFLTHAHIGHYTGLMYFGREALGKKDIPVFVMPKMRDYLILILVGVYTMEE